jgi:hypothetical protein
MSKFPVTSNDDAGVVSALNYLLSGPAGLGQNFEGYTNYNIGYLSGAVRPPFTTLEFTYTSYGVVGEYTIIVGDNNGLVVGMLASGYGITAGTTIVSIGPLTTDGSILVLTNPNTQNIQNILNFRFENHPWLYQAPLSLSTSEMLDSVTYKYTFTSTYVSTPDRLTPFYIGQPIVIAGVSNSVYNQTFTPIGVVECTTTYVICRSDTPITVVGNSSGGSASFNVTVLPTDPFPSKYNFINTDSNGVATVNNGTDRVFIAAQLTNVITTYTTVPGILAYSVFINRYLLTPSNDINNPSYIVTYDKTLTGKLTFISVSAGTNDSQEYENIFTTVIDTPAIGYYWYIVDVAFNTTSGDTVVIKNTLGLRSLTTQVVKQ